jgi:hypothetical protein
MECRRIALAAGTRGEAELLPGLLVVRGITAVD